MNQEIISLLQQSALIRPHLYFKSTHRILQQKYDSTLRLHMINFTCTSSIVYYHLGTTLAVIQRSLRSLRAQITTSNQEIFMKCVGSEVKTLDRSRIVLLDC